jgi:hypothetical protein
VTDIWQWFIFSKLRGSVEEEVAVPSIIKSALLWGMDRYLFCVVKALVFLEFHEFVLFLSLMMAML